MSDNPSVSVVIPLYNKCSHIGRALKSILNQTFQDFEVIVVDDGSTDEGAAVVKLSADQRIKLIQQENRGVSSARNRGVNEASAELIAFLDADDEWMPEHLNTLLRLRKNYPDAGAYGTACLIINEGSSARIGSYSADIPKEPWEGLLPSYFRAAAFGFPPITASTVAIPKEVFGEMGGFSTAVWIGEDTDLWGRIALKYPIAFSWRGMGMYHTEASNRACNRGESIKENIFIHTARDAIEAGEVSPSVQVDLLEYIAKKQIETAFYNINLGNPKFARENLKNCSTRKLFIKKYLAFFLAYTPCSIYYIIRRLRNILF